jgi:LysR family transcriptional regulator, glycine cleavage system transcriptional activator
MGAISSIDSLRCFLAAARALNFRRAAKSVALTPTAFSQRIKSLEDQLGRQLFLRSTRSVSLTAAGLALVPAAEHCLQAVAECERIGTGTIPQASMELTLGTRLELGLSWVVPQRRALMRSRPWLQLHLYFGSGPDLLLRVRTMEIDCAITSTQFNDTKLDAFPLHRETYVFVGSAALLARIPLRRPADASKHTLLDAARDLPLFRYWRDARAAHLGLHFARAAWLGSIGAIRQEVLDGAGVAVLPEYFVQKDLARGRLQRVFPEVTPLHDLFRLVFRASDPRRAIFESLAGELAQVPLH